MLTGCTRCYTAWLLLILSGLSGCTFQTSPLRSEQASDALHKAMLSDPTSRGLIQIPPLDDYLNSVMQNILRGAEPDQTKGKTIPVYLAATAGSGIGADAYPDHTIYVRWRTISALESEDQLAALLAHEVSHVLLNHGQNVSVLDYVTATGKSVVGLVPVVEEVFHRVGVRAWSRKQELQADELGLILVGKAGYNPDAYFDLLQILEAASAPGETPSTLSDMLSSVAQSGSYTINFGQLRFGAAENTHPDYDERRIKLATLLKSRRKEFSFPDQQQERYNTIRNTTPIAAALRGIEAATQAAFALRSNQVAEALSQFQIARKSPIGNTPEIELLNIVFSSRGNRESFLAGLYNLARSPQSPIFYSMVTLGASLGAQNWRIASGVSHSIQQRFDPPPNLLPLMVKTYGKRQRELEAKLPRLPSLNIPYRAKGFEQEYEEWSRLQDADLKATALCLKSATFSIIATCTSAGQ